ncbi:uncharacterized protein LTR77_006495 [Saxophila tyrrhenica]|uniref:DASH complex subunit SPC34 n=1 Tax=Saxophila tyrrhenica TaxID=1690608 RepID=A0AAV9P816_9PEZI|nr:hypothetical protein LTR77_006495 [Saxophila tyrrhenica]
MAALLSSHLEQISLCATSIADLSFQSPKMFTNALINNQDITTLIRDTEQHERALFHLAPPPLPKFGSSNFAESVAGTSLLATSGTTRRQTAYAPRQPKNKAVAAVLGGDLYQRTRTGETGRQKGELDVEVLLKGAEKLAAVYPIPGANDRIAGLRRRHQQLAANINHYESLVAEQSTQLQAMNRPTSRGGYSEPEDVEAGAAGLDDVAIPMTKEDLEREEQEVRDLERKKRALEERVEGMERDLGGLMR